MIGAVRSVHVPLPNATAWVAAIALYVVGDVATTAVGLSLGAVETNPAALALIGTVGLWPAMLILKAAVVSAVAGLWFVAPTAWRVVVPTTLAVLGAAVVLVNSGVVTVMLLEAAAGGLAR